MIVRLTLLLTAAFWASLNTIFRQAQSLFLIFILRRSLSNEFIMIIRLYLAFMAFSLTLGLQLEGMKKCEPMKNNMCKDSQGRNYLYNSTIMPNFANHRSQADAIHTMTTYVPLVETNCHEHLQFLLCAVYVPMCHQNDIGGSAIGRIGPCRPLCNQVKRQCEPKMVQFGYPWPDDLNCKKFPMSNEEAPCMFVPQGMNNDMNIPVSSINTLQSNPFFLDKAKEYKETISNKQNTDLSQSENLEPLINLINNAGMLEPAKAANMDCGMLKKSQEYWHHEKKGCMPKCQSDILYTKDEKSKTYSLLVASAAIVFFFSAVTVIIYTINHCSSSVKTIVSFSKWVPVYLAFSFTGYTFGLLLSQIGQLQDPKWTCVQDEEVLVSSTEGQTSKSELLAAQEGHRSTPCIIVFLFVYFFGLATTTWWGVVATVWTIAQSTPINKSSLANVAKLSHIFGWGIPALMTLIAILLQKVQADELTSICLPGGLQDDSSLLLFMVIPEGIFSSIGFIMYIIGFFYAFCCGNATTDEKLRGKGDAKTLKSLRWKVAFYGGIFIICKVKFIFFTF